MCGVAGAGGRWYRESPGAYAFFYSPIFHIYGHDFLRNLATFSSSSFLFSLLGAAGLPTGPVSHGCMVHCWCCALFVSSSSLRVFHPIHPYFYSLSLSLSFRLFILNKRMESRREAAGAGLLRRSRALPRFES